MGGNITTRTKNGTPLHPYGYASTGWKDLLTSFDGTSITYDAIGNPNNWRDGMTFTWQAGRQLATLQKGTTGISYTYSSDGTRLTKTVNGVKTSYTWDGAQLVSQKTGNEAIYFLYHGSSRVGLEYKGNTYYYIYNLQGDVVGLVNSSGTSVVSYTYDAWGNPESISGSMASTLGAANPFRYRSYYFDTESGLYYLMSRYYDPVVGRFLNADVYTTTGQGFIGCNMFAYCLNNPVLYQDSNGQSVVLTLLTFGCVVAGFCALVATAYVAYQVVDHYVDGSSALRIPKIADNVIPFIPPPQNNNNNKKQEGPVPIVPPIPKPKPKPNDKSNDAEYSIWFASYNKATRSVEIGPGVSLKVALTYLLSGQEQSFMCKDFETATTLTNAFRNTRIYEIDRGKAGVPGYYYHYHLNDRHGNPHIWHY